MLRTALSLIFAVFPVMPEFNREMCPTSDLFNTANPQKMVDFEEPDGTIPYFHNREFKTR